MPISEDHLPPVEQERLTVAPARPSSATPADGVDHRLDPSSITVDRIAGGIFSAVVAVMLFVVALLLVVFGPLGGISDSVTLVAAWMLLVGLIGGLNYWWPARRYRHTSYRVTDEGIRIRRGVVWRSTSSVPRSRVQHTDVSQGPLERYYGLATLVVYTAGTQHAAVSLGGLPYERAMSIRDFLIVGGEDDAV